MHSIDPEIQLDCNILVTASGLSPVGVNTVSCLKDRVRKIVGVDIKDTAATRFFVDKFYLVPPASQQSFYVNKLLKICRHEKINIILPLTIEELLVCVQFRKYFIARGVAIAGENDFYNIFICNDKWLTNQYLYKHGIAVPKAWAVSTPDQLLAAADKLNYPARTLVFKPRVTHGSRGLRLVSENYDYFDQLINRKPDQHLFITLTELVSVLNNCQKMPLALLMDYLIGDDYSVYAFCHLGEVLSVVSLQRAGLLPGMSIGGEIKFDSVINNYVKAIVKAFNFSGPINLQLIKTKTGPLIYEINTRLSATTIAAAATGLNYPLFTLLQALGQVEVIKKIITAAPIKSGLKLFRVQREIFCYQDNFFEL